MSAPGPSLEQYQSLLVGGALIAAAALTCVMFLRCARHRARAAYAQEMAVIQEQRAEIDAAAAAEEGRRPSTPAAAASPTGLRPALLSRLPTFSYADPTTTDTTESADASTSGGGGGAVDPVDGRSASARRCIICMDPLAAARCVTVPCGHIFHAECALPWLADKGTCPECRLDVGELLDPKRRKGKKGGGGD